MVLRENHNGMEQFWNNQDFSRLLEDAGMNPVDAGNLTYLLSVKAKTKLHPEEAARLTELQQKFHDRFKVVHPE